MFAVMWNGVLLSYYILPWLFVQYSAEMSIPGQSFFPEVAEQLHSLFSSPFHLSPLFLSLLFFQSSIKFLLNTNITLKIHWFFISFSPSFMYSRMVWKEYYMLGVQYMEKKGFPFKKYCCTLYKSLQSDIRSGRRGFPKFTK